MDTEEVTDTLALVQARIRCLAARRVAWLQTVRDGEPEFQKFSVSTDEVRFVLEQHDHPAAEEQWLASDDAAQWNEQQDTLERRIQVEACGPYGDLVARFSLSQREEEILQLCITQAMDPAFRRVCAYLDPFGYAFVTENLAARLFGWGAPFILQQNSTLLEWEIIRITPGAAGEPRILQLDTQIHKWLLGEGGVHEDLEDRVKVIRPRPSLPGWTVPEIVDTVTEHDHGAKLRISVVGRSGTGRRTLAANVCDELDMPLLCLDTSAVPDDQWDRTCMLVQRQAVLGHASLGWSGEKLDNIDWDRIHLPLHFVMHNGNGALPIHEKYRDVTVALPRPTSEHRKGFWEELVPQTKTWSKEDRKALFAQQSVSIGDIAAVSAQRAGNADEAAHAIQRSARKRIGDLAQWVECTFDWDDLVVEDKLLNDLKDFTFEAQARADFWDQKEPRRLFPYGRGLMGLCTGDPGTGKTMAAQIMAHTLKMDLYRVDLSAVVSKYVGETSKNLTKILDECEHMNVLLFFDEADALFSKRTEVKDAHDRFANTDTNSLLQRIENYEGIVLMTTNKQSNIDPAFVRRIRYYFDFSKPDVLQRQMIWEKVIAGLLGKDGLKRLRKDIPVFARTLELTGSQIKFSVLAAVFVAKRKRRKVAREHLIAGIARELSKEGKALTPREREVLNGG